jgi:hypothetical protein
MPKDKSREMNIIKPVNEHLLNRPFLYSTHQLKADKRMIVSEFNNYLSRRVPYSADHSWVQITELRSAEGMNTHLSQ